MSEPSVSLDPSGLNPTHGLNPTRQELRHPLDDQVISALRAAADRVRADYSGEPVEVVCRRLLDETRAGLPPDTAAGFVPDMEEFCRVAVAIVRGDLQPDQYAPRPDRR